MTREQVRLAMIPLIEWLVRAGNRIVDFDGLDNDVGQIMVRGPAGQVLAVELPITLPLLVPLVAFVADAEARIRVVLTPFEGEAGRGFGGSRGTLKPGEAGFSASDGWV